MMTEFGKNLMNNVALIPARSGSKRIPDKNIRMFNGVPLLVHSINAAKGSGLFSSIICVTDSERYARIAIDYGAEVPVLRPKSTATDTSPDFEWVSWILSYLASEGNLFQTYSILRPTSPFRKASTIQRAYEVFLGAPEADSLRAIKLCSEHPGKMWTVDGQKMSPLIDEKIGTTAWHSSPYTSLPKIYVQDASLEISKPEVLYQTQSISGLNIIPFTSQGYEGFDINTEEDWMLAEVLLAKEKL